MISYSTNWMGPISLAWYRDRGLTYTATHVMEQDSKITDHKKGDVIKREEIAISYSAGRMDIRDDSKEGYDGWYEYSLAPMRSEDWNLFSTWLDDLETETLWTLDQILEEYRQDTGHVIRWWKEDEIDAVMYDGHLTSDSERWKRMKENAQ